MKKEIKLTTTTYHYDNSNLFFYEIYAIKQGNVIGKIKISNTTSLLGREGKMIELLNVSINNMGNGIGRMLIQEAEDYIELLGAEFCVLYCIKDSWMEKWYKRLGYKFHVEKDGQNNWLYKNLK